MKCFIGQEDFQIKEPTVVTIGKFDGRHRGHQKLLGAMLKWKQEWGYKTAVFTFDMAPAAYIQGTPQKVITTNQERRNNMEKMGIDYLVEYPFKKEVAHLSAEEFLKAILLGQMHAKAIVVGTDCGFGYQRKGDARLLERLKEELGYELEVIEKEQDPGQHRDISSTYVKEELDRGNMEKVCELLGEPYAIHGLVVHGNHVGGPVLGFPTANVIPPPEKYLPPFGVYVSRILVDKTYYGGITNIGKKPTVTGDNPVGVETFVFGLDKNLYGKQIEVQLLNFERPEKKFDSLEQLKSQLEKDKEYGMAYLSFSP